MGGWDLLKVSCCFFLWTGVFRLILVFFIRKIPNIENHVRFSHFIYKRVRLYMLIILELFELDLQALRMKIFQVGDFSISTTSIRFFLNLRTMRIITSTIS
jgi:hypothetical protein